MFSEKHRYTLKTLVYLATVESDEYTTISDLTETLDIPRGYLNRIIPELVDFGYIDSKKGLGGGVKLAQSPDNITVRSILEDTGALVHRTDDSYEACCVPDLFDDCMIDMWMDKFRTDVIQDTTLAELRDQLISPS